MLVFSTKLPLKPDTSYQTCIELFIQWITQSEHYPINSISYDINSRSDFTVTEGAITFSISYYADDQIELAACRLENREKDAVWVNDCIVLQQGDTKTLLIQLNCNRLTFNSQLPPIHKPYIVRQFVEGGYCGCDGSIAIGDIPIISDDATFDLCTKIMTGKANLTMPVVYISCDYWGGTAISAEYLARQLSGVAHVFVEKQNKISMKLKESTSGKNVYNGYVGIYLPGSTYCEKFDRTYFEDHKAMGRAIIDSVWSALINRIDASVYNWNQIMTLQAKQKMAHWQDMSIATKEELDKYLSSFDSENEELKKKVDSLNLQNQKLHSQLDAQRIATEAAKAGGFYKLGSEQDLYPGEHSDLLYSILSQALKKYDENSRAHTIITSLLQVNPFVGQGKQMLEDLKNILGSGGRLTAADKGRLKNMGFVIEEEGSHYKITFHDSRYMFTIAKTPSDHREGKNLFSDISKMLDIDRKIF